MKEQEQSINEIVSPTWAEGIAQVSKVGLGVWLATHGAPPGTETAAVALLDQLTRPFLSKRYEQFGHSVIERLARLEERDDRFQFAALTTDEHFVTVLLQATRDAVATHEREKVDALRNAVVNTAAKIDIKEDLQLVLLELISQLTPLHIRMLLHEREYWRSSRLTWWDYKFRVLGFADEETEPDWSKLSSSVDGIHKARDYAQRDEHATILEAIMKDLVGRNLIWLGCYGDLDIVNLSQAILYGHGGSLTWLGESLVRYISDPVL